MMTHCPVCKKEYGFINRILKPVMCSECYKQGAEIPKQDLPAFETNTQQPPPSTSTPYHAIDTNHTPSSSDIIVQSLSDPKYPVLRSIANIYRALAFLFGMATIILAIIGLSSKEISFVAISLISGIVAVVTNLAIAEGIFVFLSIEENTRKTNHHIQDIIMSNKQSEPTSSSTAVQP